MPLVRVPRTLPKILEPDEARALLGALRTHRDRATALAMLLGGKRAATVVNLFADLDVRWVQAMEALDQAAANAMALAGIVLAHASDDDPIPAPADREGTTTWRDRRP